MINKQAIWNNDTLNIFADASIASTTGCYGAVGVCKDDIVDIDCRLAKDSTNNNSEIKAIRSAVNMAIRYKDQYQCINIFSDSQISIFGLRDRIYNWNIRNDTLYTVAGTPVQSQSIYIQIVYMILNNSLQVSFFHQKGHVSSHIDSLTDAQHVFEASNGIRDYVDMSLIRYISDWNNYIDQNTRSKLSNLSNPNTDPIEFKVNRFDTRRYKELIGKGGRRVS